MKRLSSDKRIDRLLRSLLARKRGWAVLDAGKHLKVVAPTGRKVAVSRTPSDRRAYLNVMADIRRLEIGCETRTSNP